MYDNLYDFLNENAASERPFLLPEDGDPITYEAFRSRAAQFANALAACGVAAGDRVAVQAVKQADCLALYAGCLRLGAVYLPLNSAYTPAEIDYFVRDAEPVLFVTDAGSVETIAPPLLAAGVPRIEALDPDGTGSLQGLADAAAGSFGTRPVGRDALAAILYTSGTTGRAKGAMLSHGNLGSNAAALVDIWAFSSADTLLHALPIFHTHGLFVGTNTLMRAGGTIRLMPGFDLDRIIARLPEATVMMGVPTFYTRLLSRPEFDRALVSGMRLFISGSAPLSPEVHRAFLDRTGHAILERYGMTESNMIASNPLHGERRPGAVGFPLPDVSVRIADPDTGAMLEPGDVGSVEVKGPNIFSGYWRNPEKTAEEFRDGWFITGDLGRFDSDGYLALVGRGKDLIISGGFNVYPVEVETAINACGGVAESAVIGVPHADFGEGVVAVVVPAEDGSVDERTILAELAGTLARYKHPKRIVTVDTLPRNTMGKVQKASLREDYADLLAR